MQYNYTAIIIEPRKHKALEFVLNNILDCLSKEWRVILFHGINNVDYSINIASKLNNLYNDRLNLVQLDVENLNQKTYSKLLATKTIIYDYIDTEYFLIFQTDSIIIKQNSHLMNYFLNQNYDYVGAPWLICGYKPTQNRDYIGNGGFSLRKTKTMLNIIEKHEWDENNEWHEDLFFTKRYDDIYAIKPPYDIAKYFCVDEVFSYETMAIHRSWCHSHFESFSKLYPECIILKNLQDVEI